jgi:hypothetical protein
VNGFASAFMLMFPTTQVTPSMFQVQVVNKTLISPVTPASNRRQSTDIATTSLSQFDQAIFEVYFGISGPLAPLEALWNAAAQTINDAKQEVDEAVGAVSSFTATLANEVASLWSSPVPESVLRLTPVKDASGVPIGPGSDTPIKRTACTDIDLCIRLDASGSIEMTSEGGFPGAWAVEKELAVGIIQSMGSVRNLLVLKFSDEAIAITTNTGNISQAIADIRAASYSLGGTNIPAALRKCKTAIEGMPPGTAHVGPIVVLITDGQGQADSILEASAIKSYKSPSYATAPKIFTLGMGNKTQIGLLRAISSGTGRAFLASDGAAATLLVNSLTKTACDPATLNLMRSTHFGMTKAEMAQFGAIDRVANVPAATAARWASTHYVMALMSTLVYHNPLADLNGTFATPYTGGVKVFDVLHDIGLTQWAHVEVPNNYLWGILAGFPDAQVLVASSGDDIIVALRGSQEAADWFTDLKTLIIGVPWQSPRLNAPITARVHEGFLAYSTAIYEGVAKILSSYANTGSKRVWFTGHSLGGAAAQLLAALFAGGGLINSNWLPPPNLEIAGVITYEAPLPGK